MKLRVQLKEDTLIPRSLRASKFAKSLMDEHEAMPDWCDLKGRFTWYSIDIDVAQRINEIATFFFPVAIYWEASDPTPPSTFEELQRLLRED